MPLRSKDRDTRHKLIGKKKPEVSRRVVLTTADISPFQREGGTSQAGHTTMGGQLFKPNNTFAVPRVLSKREGQGLTMKNPLRLNITTRFRRWR